MLSFLSFVNASCILQIVRMSRSFQIRTPSESDVARIASIHLAAMDRNPLLHVQFPSATTLGRLNAFLEGDLISELRKPNVGILVACDTVTNDVVSYAKWDYPSSGRGQEGAKLETGDLRNLEGCRRELLERYAALAEETEKRAIGDTPCYRAC
jgi:hypothetical protein